MLFLIIVLFDMNNDPKKIVGLEEEGIKTKRSYQRMQLFLNTTPPRDIGGLLI